MLPKIKIENARGEILDFSSDARYAVTASNTGAPPATINLSKIALNHGKKFNSASCDERNLILTVHILQDVGRARLNLYRYFTTGGYIKIYYTTENLDVWIDGYIDAIECDEWTLGQYMQVSILCPYPFWQDLSETYTDGSNVTNLLEFPWSAPTAGVELSRMDTTAGIQINNAGQVESGIIFTMRAKERSLQPRLYNLETGERMGFYLDMFVGDIVTVNTTQGSKSVTLERDGVTTNCVNTVMPDSTWLQLAPGVNSFSYTVDEGDIHLGIYHTNKYQGV